MVVLSGTAAKREQQNDGSGSIIKSIRIKADHEPTAVVVVVDTSSRRRRVPQTLRVHEDNLVSRLFGSLELAQSARLQQAQVQEFLQTRRQDRTRDNQVFVDHAVGYRRGYTRRLRGFSQTHHIDHYLLVAFALHSMDSIESIEYRQTRLEHQMAAARRHVRHWRLSSAICRNISSNYLLFIF